MATRKQKGGGTRKRGGWRRTPSIGHGPRTVRCTSCGEPYRLAQLRHCPSCGMLVCTRCEVWVRGLASVTIAGTDRRAGCRACSNK